MSQNQVEIQVLPSKSSMKSASDSSMKKKVSFAQSHPPKQVASASSPIRTTHIRDKSRVSTDIDSDTTLHSSMDRNHDHSRSSNIMQYRVETPKNFWRFSNLFATTNSKEMAVVEAPKRFNPFGWVSSKLVSFVKNAQNFHHGNSNHIPVVPEVKKRPVPPPPLPKRVVVRPSPSGTSLESNQSSKPQKRDSAISLHSALKKQKQSTSKIHVCRFCGGTTMVNPYRLCRECNGTGVSDSNLATDIYQTGKRVVFSLLEWIAPSKPSSLAEQTIPISKVTSYPRTSFDSNTSRVRNPRSSLDPGPQSDWSQELDYRKVTKQYVRQTNRRRSRSSSDPHLASLVSTNEPLKQILETVEAPSEVGFADIVERHC